ncbi:hypothetical protein HAL07_04590 [Helicobacter ailurogastricus]|uniref:Uncharacterized protein n=1 Tax=Helicobacter ailurogastricus TaxID=1578720 RepID=A0A0K2Y0A8_9HELI|nr:hypothetical protein HAL07_04590 [Helicobacter ailurogastricus]
MLASMWYCLRTPCDSQTLQRALYATQRIVYNKTLPFMKPTLKTAHNSNTICKA